MGSRRSRSPLALFGVLALASCTGVIGTGGSSGSGGGPNDPPGTDPPGTKPPGTTPSAFTCDESQVPSELPLRRLSRLQYVNSLQDFVRTVSPANASAVMTAVAPVIDRIPLDARVNPTGDTHGGFRRIDQSVQQSFVDAGYDVAIAIGKELTSTSARIEALAGTCATDGNAGNDAACLDAFIKKVGPLAHRRALSDSEVSLYKETAGADLVKPAALADVIAQMLAGPYFLYHVEHGKAVASGETYTLAGPELANRLAYHFWQSAPDAELVAAGASGALDTDEGYKKQVDRMFADPKTLAALDQFVTEWLWLDDVKPMDGRVGDPIYDAFANGFTPTAATRDHLISDVLEAVRHVVRKGGTFADFFQEKGSFAKDDDVAKIYGVAKWTSGDPVATGPERVGLLTRPAFLATGSAQTRPIMKGVFIRIALLCDSIPPPPNNAANNPPVLSPTMTTREVVEELTEKPGTACAGCHKTLINPLGFATESFDALGRHRLAQVLFDAAGKVVGERAVNTTSTPQIVSGDDRVSTGAADLTKQLIESGRLQACFARQYFRYTFQRVEDDVKDGCALKKVSETAAGTSSMAQALIEIAMMPAFRRRTFQ